MRTNSGNFNFFLCLRVFVAKMIVMSDEPYNFNDNKSFGDCAKMTRGCIPRSRAGRMITTIQHRWSDLKGVFNSRLVLRRMARSNNVRVGKFILLREEKIAA